jgi:uncharacterized protein YigE (DUF2233 family)
MNTQLRAALTKMASIQILGFLLLFSGTCFAEAKIFRMEDDTFRIVRSEPEQVRMAWRDASEKPLFSMKRAHTVFAKEGRVRMMMNGGIFEPRHVPSGLYVEDGEPLAPLNLKDGKGNFYLKPNGIFWVRETPEGMNAGVVTSREFSKWEAEKQSSVKWAVQSGPLLLRNGKKHPAFNQDSSSRLLRNGIGVTKNGEVVAVITEGAAMVNLWTFAECFRRLGCENALYLDGTISQMKLNPAPQVKGHGFATFIAFLNENEE